VAYVNDLSCIAPGLGRMAFINAATVTQEDDGPVVSPEQAVDVFFDADLAFVDVTGQSPPEIADIAPTTFDLGVRNQVDEVLLTGGIQSPLSFHFTTIFVGNPAQDAPYDVLTVNYPIEECEVPTTTTTTTVPPVVPPVTVQPRFTG
jgi:hypothetical protein